MQVKDTGSVIKNKLKKLLSKLRGSKFVTTLVLMFKKIEGKEKTWKFLFKLKMKYNYQWKWHWWCAWINLF